MSGIWKILVFAILSIPVVSISWRSLIRIRSHGFYRFLSWECILWLIVHNYTYWFTDALSVHQIISWILLLLSIYVVLAGIYYLRKKGGSKQERADNTLYAFEKTNQLVDSGIYRYIRHPLYSSLLYLTWGIFLKHITLSLCIIALLSSVFLYITARLDEKECIRYFGNQYADYMKKSKMFIPFVF